MPATWLEAVSWCALAAGFAGAAWILYDIYGRGHPQGMRVMEAVWPITALYFGPAAVWAYRRLGRPRSPAWRQERGGPPTEPGWAGTALGVSHCGAGCTLGDILAEFAVFALGLRIAGRDLWPAYLGDYTLALLLGIGFQYFAIAPMHQLRPREALVRAAKADVLSLTAFEIGLFGWMALSTFVFFPNPALHPNSATYWFFMQIGMIAGFLTAWPVNVWLISRGIKEAM